MRQQNAFMNVVVRTFARARRRQTPRRPAPPPPLSTRGEAVRALPAFRSADFSPPDDGGVARKRTEVRAAQTAAWLSEHCASEPGVFFRCGEQNALWALGAKLTLVLLLLAGSLSSRAAVSEVGAIGLTVGDLDRELEFFTKVLP